MGGGGAEDESQSQHRPSEIKRTVEAAVVVTADPTDP